MLQVLCRDPLHAQGCLSFVCWCGKWERKKRLEAMGELQRPPYIYFSPPAQDYQTQFSDSDFSVFKSTKTHGTYLILVPVTNLRLTSVKTTCANSLPRSSLCNDLSTQHKARNHPTMLDLEIVGDGILRQLHTVSLHLQRSVKHKTIPQCCILHTALTDESYISSCLCIPSVFSMFCQ